MKTIIWTYSDEMYIIEGKSPDDVEKLCRQAKMAGVDLRLPNGDWIPVSAIRLKQSVASYQFQSKQKAHHKQGHRIGKGGNWHDFSGVIEKAELEKVTGKIELQTTNILNNGKT